MGDKRTMTKDEEMAEEWVSENGFGSDCNNINSVEANREMINAFLAGAESREKRIAELEKENEMFKKANEIIAQQRDDRDADISILENRTEELEAQIEKMECDYDKLLDEKIELEDRLAESRECY